MGCRCNDITKCTSDIFKVSEMKKLFSDTKVLNFSVSMQLQQLAINCMTTFSCVNMMELMSEEKKLNKDVTELLPNLVKKCEDKIEQLKSQKRSMQIEDIEYHSKDDD
ncbi:methylmalonyl-CoA mutase N-terminal domain/subunit [Clostridium tetanomorphum]|uniref:Uncharacterized protein n=1 Tax=Clostridium tetanomorphum TaxID=1553 RepID=A0A923E9T1_CLOTT|nr:hypothetical protein [Clostridium tetanomorphum]KAJ49500.1 hypothetical protein CTM_22891 [Clostridium tetanomorphum DSM 665]KAJ51615.1 hypothetical protein CTM_12090 [Clostridium tetanomorphum DSM 665]MBC2396515.1 hypothetical protein [Clostridium tetanomorphum]MBP1863840.1 methylmalonyl-CoA mutase N-terminal domain/subunit [Clostridium tetanomorphum]NRS84918.1 methylmalonyl-CoA mutase N-terminal domain/subunit [Clostridium tetanomorphum]